MSECNYIFLNKMAIFMLINSDGRSDLASPLHMLGGGGAWVCNPVQAPGDGAIPADIRVVIAVAA
jgi:hypothetical protein